MAHDAQVIVSLPLRHTCSIFCIIVHLLLGDGSGYHGAQGRPGARQHPRNLLLLLKQDRPRATQGQASPFFGGGGLAPGGLPPGGDQDGPGLGHPSRGRHRAHGEREDGEAGKGHGALGVEQFLEHLSGAGGVGGRIFLFVVFVETV